MSYKHIKETIGNRTRDLRSCSAVPQTIALPRALMGLYNQHVNIQAYYIILSVYMLTILNPEFFSITVVPSVDGDAAKCVSDSDTITNFRYQNLTAVSNLAI